MIVHAINGINFNNKQTALKIKVENCNINKRHIEKSIYDKGFNNISFGNNLIDDSLYDYLYKKSLLDHKHEIKELNPKNVEDYFHILGIPCSIKTGSLNADKMIAYGCYNTAEILRQINYILPAKIDIEEMDPKIVAACYYASNKINNHPVRTVVFNPLYDWNNHITQQISAKQAGFSTTDHFLHPFIHEFGHNVHFHKLYSKFGCMEPGQGYYHNPHVADIMNVLQMKLYDNDGNPVNNPYISTNVRNSMKASSKYGSTLLPETFAEEFTKAIINNTDLFSLRLKRHPFPINTNNETLNQVLYETWERLVADGQGLI